MLRHIIPAFMAALFLVFLGSGIAHASPQETWKSADAVLAKSGETWKSAKRIQPDTELTREDGTTFTLAACGYDTVWECEEARKALPPPLTADQIKIAQLQGELNVANDLAYYYAKDGTRHTYKDADAAKAKELTAVKEANNRYMGAVLVLGVLVILLMIAIVMFVINIMQRNRSGHLHGPTKFDQGPPEVAPGRPVTS